MAKITIVAVDIRSTHNIGSLFRTADGFGASLVLVGITPRPVGGTNDERLPHVSAKATKEIAKTALGAELTVNWRYFPDINSAISEMRSEGMEIVAIEQSSDSLSIKKLIPTRPTALLLGPEVEGLSNETLQLCDEIYEIPMTGQKESFNVAVAAGIVLYQATED
jgi:23S rRNA (guanosine2251-2'-O)-methyltransferase